MDEQLQFLESMNRIASVGKEHNGHVTRAEVIEELKVELNETQWDVLGDFLFHRQVLLEGFTPKEEVPAKAPYQFSQDEQTFMHFYEDDLRNIERKSEEELNQMLKHGEEVYDYLLPWIYEICKGYADGREPLGDLVQEANLKAFIYVNGMTAEPAKQDLQSLHNVICNALESYLLENGDMSKEQSKIVDKLNQLVEATEALKAQDATFTIDDLSEFLDIPVAEIEELLKLAGE
ncbi:hypothetical protein SAMN02910358_02531 [Lachnospiraceae bacterium XBB1006]|nr:hypothetical protein SAMN02910358_02531 [Lachnospiraceae bacterium XBB1006]